MSPTDETVRSVRAALDALVPSAHDLSGYADCTARTPEAREWLADVRASMVEDVAYAIADAGEVPDDLSDMFHEVADLAVPVYTAERFDLFAATGAWVEDIEGELGMLDGETEARAGAALYLIAVRLCGALWDETVAESSDDLDALLDLLPTEWTEEDFAIEPEPLDIDA